jgi:hypothetical protein
MMTDAQAKAVLRTWANRTKIWPPPTGLGYWLRARPGTLGVAVTCPSLRSPGARLFTTQPDGLWLFLGHTEYADAFCVEVCNSIQNLNDKRSRYMPSSHSLLAAIPLQWLDEVIAVQRGGMRARWEASRCFQVRPPALLLPVRHLRVLYALPPNHYTNWKANHTPTGYEYFCRQNSLNTFNSPPTRRFLRQMSIASHFRTR